MRHLLVYSRLLCFPMYLEKLLSLFFEEIGREGPYLVTLIKLSLITVLMSMYMPHPVTGRVMR
jgi:hypothetical protein